ncbi:MAG: hypothetical protein PF590_01295 [Candidatus Delongbacteria bacterium]|jgi:hypothetical protein|nr:hypothetical protein [Candidatus Delongbacteria bacterium]
MNKVTFEINDKLIHRDLPSSWNELNKKQLLIASPIVLASNVSDFEMRRTTLSFLNLKKKHIRLMNYSQLDALCLSLEFLYKENKLTKNHFPKVGKFIGPENGLKNISAAEFAFADRFLNSFMKHRDEKHLNLLIASIYRTAPVFEENNIEKDAKQIAKFPLAVRLAI